MKNTLSTLNTMLELKPKKKNKKGFTLVELVIVIAILAIIAVIAIPTVTGVIQSANKSTDASNAQAVQVALKSCYAEVTAGTMKIDPATGAQGAATPATADTLTVTAALKAEGLQDLDTLEGNIKASPSDKHFYSLGSGVIKAAYDKGASTTAITKDQFVKDALGE